MSGIVIPRSFSLQCFRNTKGPLIDVRSPGEFQKGHWPGATNIPLFNDQERSLIGTSYKKEGRRKAIHLGIYLIKPKLPILKKLLETKCFESNGSSLKIYCWRGGLRSSSMGWLANLLGIKTIILKDGYKSYRRWSLNQFEKQWPLRIIGGKTGTGKTSLLLDLEKKGISTINLEGLANHRGSSFGGIELEKQPTSENFENILAEKLNQFEEKSITEIWLEDESIALGQCRIPKSFFSQMNKAPLIEIIKNSQERVSSLVKEYGKYKEEDLREATIRIRKRLGPQRTSKALQAIEQHNWEQACLIMLEYYDKCYEYSLSKIDNKKEIDLSGIYGDQAIEKFIQATEIQ